MGFVILLACLVVVAVFWATRSCGIGCHDAIDHDAMRKVYFETPHYSELDVWLSQNYEPSYWNPQFEALDAELRRMEEWSKTQGRCVRAAYGGWIRYSRRSLSAARFELKHQWNRKEMQSFESGLEKERTDREAYEKLHTIPRP